MGKLSKREIKEQKTILDKFNEQYIGDVTESSAYFTPVLLALDFALMVPTHGVIVDLCAGIGVLSWAAMMRDSYEGNIKKIICIERDQKYLEIGKKLVQSNKHTEVIWVQGDMFDKEMWDKIILEHGPIDCLISNPPYGTVTKTDKDRSWLKYTGSDLD